MNTINRKLLLVFLLLMHRICENGDRVRCADAGCGRMGDVNFNTKYLLIKPKTNKIIGLVLFFL